jgi:flagellar hook-basal body complex protein FliE
MALYSKLMTLRLSACVLAAVLVTACGDPPNKEMDQAQGAIDAARAAGADRYATTEYTAATDALKRAQDAVGQRDYRQALNEALDSREHAQNAAREAADTKAQLRGEVEREMAQIAALIAEANTRLAAATRARVPRRVLDGPRTELAVVDDSVQKAGAAMRADDYLAARTALQGVKERIERAMKALETPASQSSRRAR